MSTTLEALRQEIGVRTSQPFFIKFTGEDMAPSGAGSKVTLKDAAHLLEADDYWRGHYVYIVNTQEVREVTDFDQATSVLTWLAEVASVTGTSDTYELWSTFSPLQVNKAINIALRDAYPFFFLTGSSRLALLSDVDPILTLPTTNTIRRILRVTLMAYDSIASETTSVAGAQNQIVDSDQSFSASDVGKLVVIYEGTDDSAGDIRTVSAAPDSSTLTVSSNFTANIGSGVKYRLIDLNTEQPTMRVLDNWRVDSPTFPTDIWFPTAPTGYEGHFVLIEYEYDFDELSDEDDTTTCPAEYVVLSALANLYLQKLSQAAATEARMWEGMHRATAAAAQHYALRHRWQHPNATMTQWFPDKSFSEEYPFID